MIVWVWDADGPAGRSASGVTDDADPARRAARDAITATGAETATVEWALHLDGGDRMESGYLRSGSGWTARRHDDGTITWAQFVTLAARRRAAGLVQTELATLVWCSVTTVGYAETGDSGSPAGFWAYLGGTREPV